MRYVLIGLAVYVAAALAWWGKCMADRPHTCPKGHTDFFHLSRWHCRQCALATERRKIRRYQKEAYEIALRNRG